MSANNPNAGGGNGAPNPDAQKWESLYEGLEKRVKENLLDDKEFIENRAKKRPIEHSPEDVQRELENAETFRAGELEEIDALKAELERINNRTDEEYTKEHTVDFAGETNVNSRTGKERTFSNFDLYSSADGEQRKDIHDIEVLSGYVTKFPDESAKEHGQRIVQIHEDFPRGENESLEDYRKRIEEADRNGEISKKATEHIVDPESETGKWLKEELKNVDEWQEKGNIDDEKANKFRKELYDRAAENQLKINQQESKAEQQAARAERLAELKKEKAKNQAPTVLDDKKQEADDSAAQATAEAEAKAKAEAILNEKQQNIDDIVAQALAEAQARAEAEAEARAKAEAEEQAKRAEAERIEAEQQAGDNGERGKTAAEIQKQINDLEREQSEDEKRLDEIKAKMELLKKGMSEGMVGINADYTKDKEMMAVDFAEQKFNEERGKKGPIKKWIMGAFKKNYELIYRRDIMNGKEKVKVGDKEMTLDEIIESRKAGAFERVKRYADSGEEDKAFIHEEAGEKAELNKELTEKVGNIIRDFANDPTMTKEQFEEAVGRQLASDRDRGNLHNNYYELAEQAREFVKTAKETKDFIDAKETLDQVMAKFKVYDATIRDEVRTGGDKSNYDKALERIEQYTGSFAAVQVVAGAAAVASLFTRTGAKAIAGAAGGIAVSGAVAGYKEYRRISEDRIRMMRDRANGISYEWEDDPSKASKYEKKIGGTLYEVARATDLTANINNALEKVKNGEGSTEDLLNAIAAAKARINISDKDKKDLIGYTSEDERGNERLALDVAVIEATKALSDEEKNTLKKFNEKVGDELTENVDKLDKAFNHKRLLGALAKGGKSIALSTATFFASQEIMALRDPSKIGVFEKSGLVQRTNNPDAEETILASNFGRNLGTYEITPASTQAIEISDGDPSAQAAAINAGYTDAGLAKEATTEWPTEPTDVRGFKLSELPEQLKQKFKYDGWANNGTTRFDGNELRAEIQNGQFVSTMFGNSTMGNQVFDYNELANAGKIKAFLTIGDQKFELVGSRNAAGQLIWGENGIFTTSTGETIQALGENGEKLYRYFEIGLDNGVDADGFQHIIPFATDVGKNTFDGVINRAITMPIEHPGIRSFVKYVAGETATRGMTTEGITLPFILSHKSLSKARRKQSQPEPAPTPELQSEPALEQEQQRPGRIVDAAVVASTPRSAEPTPAPVESQPAPTIEQTPEEQAGEAEIRREIEEDDILDDADKDMLTGSGARSNDAYSAWYLGLTPEKRSRVDELRSEIIEFGANHSTNLARGFIDWYYLRDMINNQQ